METIQEMTDGWLAAGKKKGLKMPVKGSETEEIFLSKVKMVCESAGVKLTESRQRITRNNGSGTVVTESDRSKRIERIAKDHKMTIREATIFGGYGDPGTAVVDTKTAELAEAWTRYCPALKPEEVSNLVKRNIPVPSR
jgi:hypothetical protein